MSKRNQQWDGGRHPDGLAEAIGEKSLGNPGFVHSLVAQFAGEIQAICKRGESGDLDTPGVRLAMQEASRRMSAIFTGKTGGYHATSWNTARLGGLESKARGFLASLDVHYETNFLFDETDPVAGLFFALSHQVVDAYMAARKGATEHHLPGAMQQVIGMLLGYPDQSVEQPKPSKPAAVSAVIHPKTNDHGEPVRLHQPHEDGDAGHWGHPEKIATFTPRGLGGDCPYVLYGVPFKPWDDHPKTAKEWSAVEGQMPDLDEPPPPKVPKGKHLAAGVVVEEPDGRVWTISPSNGFGGYKNTFPKGRVEGGIDMQASAIKEAFEESGLKVEITGFLIDLERSTTTTRFYLARRVGGDPTEMGWEAQAVHLVPREALADHLTNKHDAPLVAALTKEKA